MDLPFTFTHDERMSRWTVTIRACGCTIKADDWALDELERIGVSLDTFWNTVRDLHEHEDPARQLEVTMRRGDGIQEPHLSVTVSPKGKCAALVTHADRARPVELSPEALARLAESHEQAVRGERPAPEIVPADQPVYGMPAWMGKLREIVASMNAEQQNRLRAAVRAELDKIAALAPENIPVVSNMRIEPNGTFTADVTLPGRAVVDADPQIAIERVANLVGVRTDPERQDTENWDTAKTEPNAASPIGDPSKGDVQ